MVQLGTTTRTVLAAVAIAVFMLACGGGGGGGGSAVRNPADLTASADGPSLGNSLPGPRPVVGPREFVNFESGQVRPLAVSTDGSRLFALNTPDNRLEVFSIGDTLTPLFSVPVGLEPVALAEDPRGRVWVVNHLSDSISVVDVKALPPRVLNTLWVGDEPRDIVFAGEQRERAFITTAHRGQNSPVDPAMNTASVGRADVWVFDSESLDQTPGGLVMSIITLFGDRPRPLAVSPDGLTVYAGIFLSGNQTTVLSPGNIPKAAPTTSADNVPQPDSGLIVRWNGNNWVDERGAIWNGSVPFSLPDYDIFSIDALTLAESGRVSGVGTILFNIAVNPISGALYVSNMQSKNHIRFSGPATRANTTVRGHVTDQRVTIIEDGATTPRILNKHIDFGAGAISPQLRDLSLSTPLGMAVSQNGQTLYVAAFGSGKIGVFDTQELADNSYQAAAADRIGLSAGGPSAIVLDETRDRGYALTRFDNGISVIDLVTQQEIAHLQMHNPEPASLAAGRKFLYDATITSGNGNDSCASCHVFGDTDGLAWDLGEPDASVVPIENVFIPISRPVSPAQFHPMKGPMTTQSMRGLRGHGPMHWRGDRSGVNRVGDETLEEAAFKEFNSAFDAFAALEAELDEADMQSFTDFSMEITYPPNPLRELDNSLVGNQVRGDQMFREGVVRIQTDALEVCIQCHTLRPERGQFGTGGLSSDNSQAGERNFKIPHFRDQYQKVGMFGWGFNQPPETGPQVRGFSFNHNGATSSNFIIADLGMQQADLLALRAFLYVFPTESPAITGQQLTLTLNNQAQAMARLDLLVQQGLVEAPIPECDLVVKGVINNQSRSWLLLQSGEFQSDREGEDLLTRDALQAQLVDPEDRLTFTCTPWGSGVRIGIDRDLDGILDGDE
jgi:DNA-binding beta-propeller fold protein YncE